MPWAAPKTLTDNEVYALTAYILALNKIIGENDVMNAETLAQGEDAQPRRVHQQVSGEALTRMATAPTDLGFTRDRHPKCAGRVNPTCTIRGRSRRTASLARQVPPRLIEHTPTARPTGA